MPEPMGKHQETLDRALAALRNRTDEMLALTRSWVEINSYTANVDGVNRVGALLREAFTLPSLSCKVIPGGPEHGDHLIWRTAASGPPIVLIGHHDTVFPPGHFEGWREDGRRATGPGALDMKGGLSIIRTTLAALDEVGALAALPIIVVSVGDEEIGSQLHTPLDRGRARRSLCAGVRVRSRSGCDHHPPQGRRRNDGHRARQGGARR